MTPVQQPGALTGDGEPSVRWLAEVRVLLKPSVNDPQGLSIRGGLHALGFESVSQVRAGKLIQVWLDAPDRAAAEAAVDAMCAQLLANPVIEAYTFSLTQPAAADAGAPAL
jgi:phosphoribosylformylglycinamidine synthase